MDREHELLREDEVLYVRSGRIIMSNPTFRVSEFLDALAELISEQEELWSEEQEGWFRDGLECEVLRLNGQGWQRGRVRIRLEFSPLRSPKLLQERVRPRDDRAYLPEDSYRQQDSYSYGREGGYRQNNPQRPEEIYPDLLDDDFS